MELRQELQRTLGTSYTVDRELGGGGMSRVFVAREHSLERDVVVKVLPPDVLAGVNIDRFRREILLSARLQHPHIVPVLTTGELDVDGAKVPYYTMPFVAGESLRARLARFGALSVTEAVSVLRDIAKALAFAHEQGIVHRDIKPDNVLLAGGSATVADFGIAKALTAARDERSGGTLTQVGTSLGTPAYMAPEQAAADPSSNHRADIYALGCVAYELLAGRPPFAERTPQRLLAAHMAEKPQPITELRADLPAELAQLVMRCLEKEADTRPQSAADVVRVLETVTSGGHHPAVAPVLLGGASMLRRALLYYVAAFLVVMVVAQAAVVGIGLPGWVVPGAAVVMLLGLPVILFTAYTQRVARRHLTATPTFTPGGTRSQQHGTLAGIALKASPHVSWRRTARGGMLAFGTFVLAVAAFMGMRAAGIGPFGSLLASGQLGREPLLITDFRVENGDSTLGPVISRAVRSNLEQSRVLSLVSQSDAAAALQRMQRAPSSRVDLPLAREIAAREGVRAIVDGEVAAIGSGFLVTLRLVTADSGRELASFRQAADGPTQLIEAVDVLSRKLRDRAGESLKEVRNSPPLAQVTTASLDALRKYTDASAATALSDFDLAARLSREAIALDSGFALAWRHLAESLFNAGIVGPSMDSAITRAFELRERLAERERLSVEGDYYSTGPGADRARAIAAFTRQLELGYYGNTNSLAELHLSRREYDRAIELTRVRLGVEPGNSLSYSNMSHYLRRAGHFDSSDSVLAVAQVRGVSSQALALHRVIGLISRDSLARAEGALDSLRPGMRGSFQIRTLQLRSTVHRLRAQVGAADRLVREAGRLEKERNNARPALRDSLNAILWDVVNAAPSPAHRRRLERSLALAPAHVRQALLPYAAWLHGMLGDAPGARAHLRAWTAANLDRRGRLSERPIARMAEGEIALAERRYADAIPLFLAADREEDGPADIPEMVAEAAIGRAYDLAGQRDSAIVWLERAAVSARRAPGGTESATWLPGIEQRLGELHEAAGNRERAYAHYARFVTSWNEADAPFRARVADVRQRMVRLRDVEGNR